MDSWPIPAARCRLLLAALIAAGAGPARNGRSRHAAGRLPGDDSVQRARSAHGGRVCRERARLRGREERPHQGVRQPVGHDSDAVRRSAHEGPRLLGPRPGGNGARPQFPTRPYVYVHYVHDAAIGGTAPRWGDTCPDPPGGTGDGCVVSGRVSKLTANGNVMTGSEQVLVEDWCMQYPATPVAGWTSAPTATCT